MATKRRYDGLCPRCGVLEKAESHAYCLPCKARYMRERRPRHRDLPDEQRLRANCRAYANVYLRRGKLERQPCEHCGSDESQMHHADYTKPLAVTWLCRKCHLGLHREEWAMPEFQKLDGRIVFIR